MAKTTTLSEEIMDFFRQFLDKTPEADPSDLRFFDKLLKMKVTREKLAVFAALAVSSSMFFYFWGRPQHTFIDKRKKTKGILKTRACQTIEGDMVRTTISVSGCAPTIRVTSPTPTDSEECCSGECEQSATSASVEQPAASANVEEHSSGTGEMHARGRPCAVLATWSTRGQRPSYSVRFTDAHEGVDVSGNGRKKKVSFSKSVVEPSGDNEAYRRNPRSGVSRKDGKVRRHRHADPISKSGGFPQQTKENCSKDCPADTGQACNADNIQAPIDQCESQPNGEQQVSETVKGCKLTRITDTGTTLEVTYPLRQQDRNRWS